MTTQHKKKGLRVAYSYRQDANDESLQHEVREMFIGHHTIFSLVGLAIGGTLVSRTLWEWLVRDFGLDLTFIIGIVVFVVSGLLVHAFDETPARYMSHEQ